MTVYAERPINVPLEIHPVANIFPPMSPAEFENLKRDIGAHGQREPIWLYDGAVIDGRHRLRACEELGILPTLADFSGDDPTAFVVSLNLHRRHLNESQRAMVAANLANLEHGQRADRARDANLHLTPVTRAEAAELLSVSPRSVANAVKVKDEGTPELQQAVQAGQAAVSTAAVIATAPAEVQREIVQQVQAGETTYTQAAKEVHNHRAQGTGENEWYTPEEHLESARRVLGGIDLDPATSEVAQERVRAGRILTVADNALEHDWEGRVWLNPPYAQPAIQQFAEKMVGEYRSGRVTAAVMLTHNYTDTAWFHIAASAASAICFTRGRIGFLNPEGKRAAPTQGQAFFYYGSDVDAFAREFQRHGLIVAVTHPHMREAVSA